MKHIRSVGRSELARLNGKTQVKNFIENHARRSGADLRDLRSLLQDQVTPVVERTTDWLMKPVADYVEEVVDAVAENGYANYLDGMER